MDHPFLVGSKVYLRGLEQKDLDGPYAQWLNDQQSDVYTGHAVWPNTSDSMRQFFERTRASKNDLVLAIIEKQSEKHIGNVGLHDISWLHRNAKFAILIGDPSMRGKGIGTEVVEMVCNHAFGKLNLHRVYLGVREDNIPAVKAYSKSGFLEEGRQKQAIFSNGRFYDVISMYKLADCTQG